MRGSRVAWQRAGGHDARLLQVASTHPHDMAHAAKGRARRLRVTQQAWCHERNEAGLDAIAGEQRPCTANYADYL